MQRGIKLEMNKLFSFEVQKERDSNEFGSFIFTRMTFYEGQAKAHCDQYHPFQCAHIIIERNFFA